MRWRVDETINFAISSGYSTTFLLHECSLKNKKKIPVPFIIIWKSQLIFLYITDIVKSKNSKAFEWRNIKRYRQCYKHENYFFIDFMDMCQYFNISNNRFMENNKQKPIIIFKKKLFIWFQ